MGRKILLSFIYTFTAVIIVPAVVTMLMSDGENLQTSENNEKSFVLSPDYTEVVAVYNPETTQIEDTPFENYIKGVVAAEMPALFELDALKAQAVASRTYAYREIGAVPQGETVKAENIGQAYISVDEMKKRWGDSFQQNYDRICRAVDETFSEIMVYNNEPILAAFHSTSGGVTENSENVWSQKLDYLRSVDSPQDADAPDFMYTTRVSENEFLKKMKNAGTLISSNVKDSIGNIQRTEAGYVKSINIGSKSFTGIEIRKIFGLRSSNFTIKVENGSVCFTTKGYGHGAGMSQYGANFMAKEGSDYKEILRHYYSGVEFIKIKG